MDYSQAILAVNSACITLLVLLAVILLVATRFRGENGYAAAIIVIPNVPVYLYTMSRMLGWHELTLFMFPISYSVNTLLMPLLWLFTLKNFDADFKVSFKSLLHFLPALFCLTVCLLMPEEERLASIVHEMSGYDTWIGDINTMLLLVQVLVYFPLIFRFIHIRKKAIRDTLSDAEWMQKEWISKFMILFAVLFVIVMTCYVIWPRTDAWLIQILNVIAMSYLVYSTVAHPVIMPEVKQEIVNKESVPTIPLNEEQMQSICEEAVGYLSRSKAYLRPDLTLAILAQEMKVSPKYLSRAINTRLSRNFFEFINEMRVEEAKKRLSELDASGYNIDSIYEDCGFRSRSTFFLVFKKVVGKTPAAWLKSSEKESSNG
ncbi:helix-turn-helix domain-containing protein [Parabacteroides sp.]